jgi:hypothetical protein
VVAIGTHTPSVHPLARPFVWQNLPAPHGFAFFDHVQGVALASMPPSVVEPDDEVLPLVELPLVELPLVELPDAPLVDEDVDPDEDDDDVLPAFGMLLSALPEHAAMMSAKEQLVATAAKANQARFISLSLSQRKE